MNKKLIWLDDIRDPLKDDWLVFSPIIQPFETIWIKSYNEFTEWISKNGLPDGICFDHDLNDYQAFRNGYPEYFEDQKWPEKEKTGKDCANWLIEYCMDNKLKLPPYGIQSANPAGRENIDGILKSFIKHQIKNGL